MAASLGALSNNDYEGLLAFGINISTGSAEWWQGDNLFDIDLEALCSLKERLERSDTMFAPIAIETAVLSIALDRSLVKEVVANSPYVSTLIGKELCARHVKYLPTIEPHSSVVRAIGLF